MYPLPRKTAAPTNDAFPGFDVPTVAGPSPAPPPAPVQAPPAPTPPPAPRQPAADRAFIGTLVAISAVLASRLLLFVAIVGSFILAFRADTNIGMYILVIYSALTVIPLVYLDITAHQRGGK